MTASGALKGTVCVPGDKSISHRALIMSSFCYGESKISGLLEGEDVLNTATTLRAMGASVDRTASGEWSVQGNGVGSLAQPSSVLDFGNSGTGVRLLMGAISSHAITATLTGDASLCRRPMKRVMDPLRNIGCQFLGAEGDRLPLTMRGADDPLPIDYAVPVPSAQVKSALLLAALNIPGRTQIVEKTKTRDHSERMLTYLGAEIESKPTEDKRGSVITLQGHPEMAAKDHSVPGDPSSAAFPLVGALLVPGSEITLPNVCLNPGRIGLIETLLEMGADISIGNRRPAGGEEVGDLLVRYSQLKGVNVPADRAPSMIDEYPILAVAAAFATGDTNMSGIGELRVKESDRIAMMSEGLRACGVEVTEGPSEMTVTGSKSTKNRLGDARIGTNLDHRIAMSFLIMGLAAEGPITIDDSEPIQTSFPTFFDVMSGVGAIAHEGGA